MRNHTLLLTPSAVRGWDVWSRTSGPHFESAGTLEDLAALPAAGPPVTVALPARLCRTVACLLPGGKDAKLSRGLMAAQLEKRGLLADGGNGSAFSCHTDAVAEGRAVTVADVVSADAVNTLTSPRIAGVVAAHRVFPPADGVAAVMREGGRDVLRVAPGGRPVHAQVLSAPLALEIRLALLSLRQSGLIGEIRAVELWGAYPPSIATELAEALELPVSVKPQPAPDSARVSLLDTKQLLPPAAREAERKRRGRVLKWTAAAAVPAAGLLWWLSQHNALRALENKAASLTAAISATSGPAGEAAAAMGKMRAAQERWQALRGALEPKRYPLMHLNGITKSMGDTGVVLTRFESKGPDLSVNGSAQTAAAAYTFFTTVSNDRDLAVYAWSMAQPTIDSTGAAGFEIKGKMR